MITESEIVRPPPTHADAAAKSNGPSLRQHEPGDHRDLPVERRGEDEQTP